MNQAADQTQVQNSGDQAAANADSQQQVVDLHPQQPAELSDEDRARYNYEITEALQDNDVRKIEEIRDRLEKLSGKADGVAIKTPFDDSKNQSPQDLQQQQASQNQQDEEKPFVVYYQGKKVEREDKNRLFGYKDTGSLKAAFVKKDLELEDTKRLLNETLAKLTEAQNVRTQPQPQQKPAAQQPARQQPQFHQPAPQIAPQKPQRPQLPIPPIQPDLPDDPLDYSDEDRKKHSEYRKAFGEYQTAARNYNVQNEAYLNYLENRPGSVPEDVRKELEELRQIRDQVQSINQERQSIEEQKAEQQHWQRFSDFQGTNESFKTPIHIRDMDTKAKEWSDTIAVANGIQMPQTAPNYNDPAWQAYYMQRAEIVDRYLNEDSQVRANAAGYEPPAGIEAYYNLLDLESFRRTKISEGILGQNATLQQAYIQRQLETGDFEETLNQIRASERTKATQAAADQINQMNQTATHVNPSDVGSGPSLDAMGVSAEDYALLQEYSRIPIDSVHAWERQHPNKARQITAIASRVKAASR